MRAYNVSEFRQNLAGVLDLAESETVIIKRHGKSYALRAVAPRRTKRSGLDVGFVPLRNAPTLESILQDIQASRERR
jgi:antitoxin (DNA-binding transcriptional repressor) of toxin-antitoxin stability system